MSLIQKKLPISLSSAIKTTRSAPTPRRMYWVSVFSSIPLLTSPSKLPTELEDLANLCEKFQAIGCRIYSFLRYPLCPQGVA